MEGLWEVTLDGKAVGRCTVEREGLYCRFRCRCALPAGTIFRLMLTTGKQERNLGVLAPEDGAMTLTTRVAVRALPKGEPEFQVISQEPKRPEQRGVFVPLGPEEPMRYLTRLRSARLEVRNGQQGLWWEEN